MLDVIMSEYEYFNIYAPITKKPSMVYLEFPTYLDSDKHAWKCCPVSKIINRSDYDKPEDYHAAIDKMIYDAEGLTGEIINDDYSIYIEADIDNAMLMNKEPQLNIVGYC